MQCAVRLYSSYIVIAFNILVAIGSCVRYNYTVRAARSIHTLARHTPHTARQLEGERDQSVSTERSRLSHCDHARTHCVHDATTARTMLCRVSCDTTCTWTCNVCASLHEKHRATDRCKPIMTRLRLSPPRARAPSRAAPRADRPVASATKRCTSRAAPAADGGYLCI